MYIYQHDKGDYARINTGIFLAIASLAIFYFTISEFSRMSFLSILLAVANISTVKLLLKKNPWAHALAIPVIICSCFFIYHQGLELVSFYGISLLIYVCASIYFLLTQTQIDRRTKTGRISIMHFLLLPVELIVISSTYECLLVVFHKFPFYWLIMAYAFVYMFYLMSFEQRLTRYLYKFLLGCPQDISEADWPVVKEAFLMWESETLRSGT